MRWLITIWRENQETLKTEWQNNHLKHNNDKIYISVVTGMLQTTTAGGRRLMMMRRIMLMTAALKRITGACLQELPQGRGIKGNHSDSTNPSPTLRPPHPHFLLWYMGPPSPSTTHPHQSTPGAEEYSRRSNQTSKFSWIVITLQVCSGVTCFTDSCCMFHRQVCHVTQTDVTCLKDRCDMFHRQMCHVSQTGVTCLEDKGERGRKRGRGRGGL